MCFKWYCAECHDDLHEENRKTRCDQLIKAKMADPTLEECPFLASQLEASGSNQNSTIRCDRCRNAQPSHEGTQGQGSQSQQSDGSRHPSPIATLSTGKTSKTEADQKAPSRSSTNVKGSYRVIRSKPKHINGEAQPQAKQKPLRTDKQRERNRLQMQESRRRKALAAEQDLMSRLNIRSHETANQTAEECRDRLKEWRRQSRTKLAFEETLGVGRFLPGCGCWEWQHGKKCGHGSEGQHEVEEA